MTSEPIRFPSDPGERRAAIIGLVLTIVLGALVPLAPVVFLLFAIAVGLFTLFFAARSTKAVVVEADGSIRVPGRSGLDQSLVTGICVSRNPLTKGGKGDLGNYWEVQLLLSNPSPDPQYFRDLVERVVRERELASHGERDADPTKPAADEEREAAVQRILAQLEPALANERVKAVNDSRLHNVFRRATQLARRFDVPIYDFLSFRAVPPPGSAGSVAAGDAPGETSPDSDTALLITSDTDTELVVNGTGSLAGFAAFLFFLAFIAGILAAGLGEATVWVATGGIALAGFALLGLRAVRGDGRTLRVDASGVQVLLRDASEPAGTIPLDEVLAVVLVDQWISPSLYVIGEERMVSMVVPLPANAAWIRDRVDDRIRRFRQPA